MTQYRCTVCGNTDLYLNPARKKLVCFFCGLEIKAVFPEDKEEDEEGYEDV